MLLCHKIEHLGVLVDRLSIQNKFRGSFTEFAGSKGESVRNVKIV